MDTTWVAGELSRGCQRIVTSWAQYRGSMTPAECGNPICKSPRAAHGDAGSANIGQERGPYSRAAWEASVSRSVGVRDTRMRTTSAITSTFPSWEFDCLCRRPGWETADAWAPLGASFVVCTRSGARHDQHSRISGCAQIQTLSSRRKSLPVQ